MKKHIFFNLLLILRTTCRQHKYACFISVESCKHLSHSVDHFLCSPIMYRSANDIVICGELPFDRMFFKWSGDDLYRSNEFDFMPLQSTEWDEDIREFLLIILLNKTKTFATLKLNFNAAATMFFTFSWFSSVSLDWEWPIFPS